jgi:hypothetical protein
METNNKSNTQPQTTEVIIYTKESLITTLKGLAGTWHKGARSGNHGCIGNTLEDLLGIQENNLPIPNAAEWELKAQRLGTSALTTLFHIEPSPKAIKFVPNVLLPLYGWSHQEAGKKYSEEEMSFRQTIHGMSSSDRGFQVVVDTNNKKVLISFDASKVSKKHDVWLKSVEQRAGLNELNPQPYWGFDDLMHKAGTKLLNCFYVQAEVKKINGESFYNYSKVLMLQEFNFDGFLEGLKVGKILVDFDARTGHNHGTKFRMKQDYFPYLYKKSTVIL